MAGLDPRLKKQQDSLFINLLREHYPKYKKMPEKHFREYFMDENTGMYTDLHYPRIFEDLVGMIGEYPVVGFKCDTRDFDDFIKSDLKTTLLTWGSGDKGNGSWNYRISGCNGKEGAIRAIIANIPKSKIDLFIIPHESVCELSYEGGNISGVYQPGGDNYTKIDEFKYNCYTPEDFIAWCKNGATGPLVPKKSTQGSTLPFFVKKDIIAAKKIIDKVLESA